jgi:two-component system CheB/CheR fusion protein
MDSTLVRVVAIGASAGGLKALQDFLSQLRPANPAAIVVAQHLAPEHPSQLVNLLARATQLEVVQATDGLALEAGQIVVIPPNHDATIASGCLKLVEPAPRFGPSPSIDQLFDSLANAYGERAVAIVLSGTGSDGACGLRAVGANGGLTLVQSPESALFDAMPRAAISLGRPDLVADPKTIGSRLTKWLSGGGSWTDGNADAQPSVLASAVIQLKQSTGIDFSQYKESTLLRQIQRRMAVNGINRMDLYLQLLCSDVSEARALMQNLLVTVTSFFRDSDGFEALAKHVKQFLVRRGTEEPFRVWVPGCATGEEAYSIGMILSEAMGHPIHLSQVLKIFATDLDEHSLLIARRATYPISAARSIPQGFKDKFIIDQGSEFEIAKDLRGCVIFARHNICEDPPFPDIDLISCRNLLIYFTAALQQRVIDVMSFSLHPDRLLFLGSYESPGNLTGFRALDPLHRLYERTQEARSRARSAPSIIQRKTLTQRLPFILTSQSESLASQHVQLLNALIRVFAKPCLVLDDNHTLVEVIGDVSRFCRMPEGRLTGAAVSFLRAELQAEARALFLLARAGRSPIRSRALRIPGSSVQLVLEVTPIQVGEQSLSVLSFLEEKEVNISSETLIDPDQNTIFSHEIERLERELLASQDSLRRSLIHLEEANEELEASSEELQASSEELQSSNEELEASNEELRATNDELGVLNQQLRIRSDELESLNTDLQNIQRSLNQGMVIVDLELRVVRFTPLAVRVFGLVEADMGQSILGIPTTVPIQRLRENLLSVINGGKRCNFEASSEEISYFLQLMPYRDKSSKVLGAIITLTDISELTALRRAAEDALHEFTCLADALDQAVWKRDHTLKRILYVSSRIEELTGWQDSQICAQPELLDAAILPADQDSVRAARQLDKAGWDITYRITCRGGEQKSMREVAVVMDDTIHGPTIVGTLTDVSEQQLDMSKKQLLARAFHVSIAYDSNPVALFDTSLNCLLANEPFSRCFHASGQDLDALSIHQLTRLLTLSDWADSTQEGVSSESLLDAAQRVMKSKQPMLQRAAMPPAWDPQTPWLRMDILPIPESSGHAGLLLKFQLPDS